MKKHQRTLSTGVVIAIGLIFAYFYQGDVNLGKKLQERRNGTSTKVEKAETKTTEKAKLPTEKREVKKPFLKGVYVKGPKGLEDISDTLTRIEKGEKFPHRNDGSVFRNREKRLPLKKRGYYLEFVHPTKGQRGPGAQRIVTGKEKEIFYTPDHYETFQRVNNVH